jgi:spore maturation protein CgeB
MVSDAAAPDPRARPRVLLVGQAVYDSVIDSYRRALADHYDVRVFDPFAVLGSLGHRLGPVWSRRLADAAGLVSRAIAREPLAAAEPRLLRAAREHAPDLVLVTCIEALRPHVVAGLRAGNASCKVFGVFSDHIANFGRGYFFAADYDALFFKDRYIVDKLRAKLGWRHVRYLPQACDRVLHTTVDLDADDRARYGCDISLAGNPYLFRNESLRPLIGRDMKIWGPPPPRWVDHPATRHFTGRYVAGPEKCKAMLAAKIVLNQNHYAEIAGTNKRTFEVAAIGAFQLTDTPAIRDVFDPDTEVACFDTQQEMVERIDEFLAAPDRRREMAARAHARAHAEHTYEHRWVAHLEALGQRPPAGFPVEPARLAVRAV